MEYLPYKKLTPSLMFYPVETAGERDSISRMHYGDVSLLYLRNLDCFLKLPNKIYDNRAQILS